MNRKRKLLIEFCIAGAVLVLLLAVALPEFFRAQRSRALIYLFTDMDATLCALLAYHDDFGVLPEHFERVGVQIRTRTMGPWGPVFGGWTKNDLPKAFLHFVHAGYMDRLPRVFQEYGHPSAGRPPLLFGLYNFYAGRVDGRPTSRLDNAGFMVEWPHASDEAAAVFREAWTDSLRRAGYPAGHLSKAYVSQGEMGAPRAMVKPQAFYAPSNGLTSAGYVYLDIRGNHSPFGRETPVLRVVDVGRAED